MVISKGEPVQLYYLWAAVLIAYLAGRFVEWRIHRWNYRNLSAAGAEELIPDLMRRYYQLTTLIVPVALMEQLVWRQPVFWEMLVTGMFMIGSGHALRFWAIHSLGSLWSMRCLSLDGAQPCRRGPYRIVRNPEYFSRVIDALGIGLVIGARLSTLVYLTLLMILAHRIQSVERRQLREFASTLPR